MKMVIKILSFVWLLLLSLSCFGPFNPDDPMMGIDPEENDTGTTVIPKMPLTMVAYWRCDDSTNFVNSSSYTNISAATSSIETDVSFDTGIGGSGLSLLFNKDTYVNVLNDTALNFPLTDFTISLWCKPGLQVNSNAILVSKGDTATLSSYAIMIRDKKPGVFLGSFARLHEDTLLPSSWNHVVFSRKEGAYFLYLNAKMSSISSEGITLKNTHNFRIGADVANRNHYRGNIDEIKIERRAWSVTEIKSEHSRFGK
ncbi:MAG: LamG domain-containing protein [Chitinispirillaceae bacterium]|nr:LamG domain-containing protein [Chitinispirillaceae bacterium]